MDDDELALRHQLWLATDRAYKAATESLAAKQAQLKQLTIDQPVDDFAHADPVQHLEPLAKLDGDAAAWLKTIAGCDGALQNRSGCPVHDFIHRISSREPLLRQLRRQHGPERVKRPIRRVLEASAQAADGMRLDQSAGYVVRDLKDLPTPEKFLARAGEMIGTLKDLRAAPLAEEEFRGPVLFSSHAASTVFADLVGENIRGRRPNLGQPARTKGAFASNYKSRVLPDFLSVADDPAPASYDGKPLLGHYEVDDEGVKAVRVLAIDKGNLVNYLLGRQPIRDFPNSNGHGRSRLPVGPPEPNVGSLIITASESVAAGGVEEETHRPLPAARAAVWILRGCPVDLRGPRFLYRVWAKDGHEELIRGAVFADLDVRSLRNDLVAAGDDMTAWNWTQSVPHSVVSPSILFDELEVKRVDQNKSKLPEYPPPPLTSAP